jgi:uncharacterized protein (TIGR00296 family)
MGYSDEEGELAVRIARAAMEAYLQGAASPSFSVPPAFHEKSGVFVTVRTHPRGDMRGCIGFPLSDAPLLDALIQAARGVTEDPRFPPLGRAEADEVTVEVSLLMPPERLEAKRPKEYLRAVRVGVHGLMAERGPYRGLLLPQVAVEEGWDEEEFLSQTCMKAGLLPDAWLEEGTHIYRFESEIFAETEPRGPVVRRVLGEAYVRP